MKGPYAQIGKHRFPITDIRLRGSEVKVCIRMQGPVAPFGPAAITIFDEDGRGCWQGSQACLTKPIPRGAVWLLWYGMRMATVFERKEPRDLASEE